MITARIFHYTAPRRRSSALPARLCAGISRVHFGGTPKLDDCEDDREAIAGNGILASPASFHVEYFVIPSNAEESLIILSVFVVSSASRTRGSRLMPIRSGRHSSRRGGRLVQQ